MSKVKRQQLFGVLPLLLICHGYQILEPISTGRFAVRGCYSRCKHSLLWSLSSLCDAEDDSTNTVITSFIPEKSIMNDFISEYLRKDSVKLKSSSQNDIVASSLRPEDDFLIAIPMDACHELGLELESVQRAILYHCPVLVHACIPLATMRLPLLYVSRRADRTTCNEANASRFTIRELERLVGDTVHSVLIGNQSSNISRNNTIDDGTLDMQGPNSDGIQPLLIPFSTLEIDGIGNQILFTVGDPKSPGTRALAMFVHELQHQLHVHGWKTRFPNDPHGFPNDPHATAQNAITAVNTTFRPRVPFGRLPPNWNSYLDASPEYLLSDQGGNGISPILWGNWMDDSFGDVVRMREIGIYMNRLHDPLSLSNVDRSLLTEEGIYRVPERTVPLPKGNTELTKAEKQFELYQTKRLTTVEDQKRKHLRETSMDPVSDANEATISDEDFENDPLFKLTLSRIEALYSDNAKATGAATEVQKNHFKELLDNKDCSDLVHPSVIPSVDTGDEPLDDWTLSRIRNVVNTRARIQTERRLATKRRQDKPPLEENPIFAKYKNGTLVPKTQNLGKVPARPIKSLPFPSDEHVLGIWRVISSPTGFEVEEGDLTRSDNLVLRVDGTTAGGPILDPVTRQKASAGTWKLRDSPDNDDCVQTASAQMNIRLVIPPEKQRVLVMRGKLDRVSLSSCDLPLVLRGTFGIPMLEEKAARANAQQDLEDLVYCSGTVHIEDARTGLNREEIGTFSLQKLHTVIDPSRYTFTVPRPTKNQD